MKYSHNLYLNHLGLRISSTSSHNVLLHSKDLLIEGIGYKLSLLPNHVQVTIGKSFNKSHNILSDNILYTQNHERIIKLQGVEKLSLGNQFNKIRIIKPMDSYKNKGLRDIKSIHKPKVMKKKK